MEEKINERRTKDSIKEGGNGRNETKKKKMLKEKTRQGENEGNKTKRSR